MSIIRGRVYDPYSHPRYDVREPFHVLHRQEDTLAAPHPIFSNGTTIRWKETPEAYTYKVDLPGLGKEEVKVELEEGNVLKITGERIEEKRERNDYWYHIERSGGKSVRSFTLPGNAKADEMVARMEDGVLTITVPKRETMKTTKFIHVY